MITNIIWFIGILITFSLVFSSMTIFLENRDPSKTIAWFLVFLVFPIVGFFIYLIFGQNIKKKKIFKTHKLYEEIKETQVYKNINEFENLIQIQKEALKEEFIFYDKDLQLKKRIMSLLLRAGRSAFIINNKLELFYDGKSKFDSLKEDLINAKEHINLEYFIIKDSKIAQELKDILIKKSNQGLKIRILYDDVGCWRMWFKPSLIKELVKNGIEVHAFIPVMFPFLSRKINYRNHRKIVVIDGKIGYVGGFNIGDEYLGESKKFGFWRDTHLRIEGESVYMLQITFLLDWYFSTKEQIFEREFFPKIKYCGNTLMQIVASGPDSDFEAIHQAYFSAITQAKKRIHIQTPYFIPDEGILMALKNAALSGVDVKIIFPSIPDHKIVYYASLSYFRDLLEVGAKVYLYKKGFIHAKVVIVDSEVASVGTSNMDLRSFMLNFEINSFIYDQNIIENLENQFEQDLKDSKLLGEKEYKNRPIVQKIQESFSRLFSPIL